MEFTTAWNKMLDAFELTKDRNKVVIYFLPGNGDYGFATLIAPRLYKEPDKTMDTVKRAWEKFCMSDPDEYDKIVSIELLNKDDVVPEKPLCDRNRFYA